MDVSFSFLLFSIYFIIIILLVLMFFAQQEIMLLISLADRLDEISHTLFIIKESQHPPCISIS